MSCYRVYGDDTTHNMQNNVSFDVYKWLVVIKTRLFYFDQVHKDAIFM